MRRMTPWLGALLCAWNLAAAAGPDDRLPPIGTIDFFGLRTVKEADVRKHLPFKEGDQFAKGDLIRDGSRIATSLGVSEVTLAYICCTTEQKLMAYVGVAEKPRPLPAAIVYQGTARLPEAMIAADDEYGAKVREAMSQGKALEDHSQGHALNEDYPPLRAIQQKFIDYARDNTALAAEVLTSAGDVRHRAAAAVILGYAPDKRAAARVLARGAGDSAAVVRNNATRALGVIAEYSTAHPELAISIDPRPFIGMLNSVVWTDLNKGLFVLSNLTATRNPALLKQLEEARPVLADMCHWKNPGHAMQACMLLRRMEGKPDWPEVGAGGPTPP